MLSKNYDRLILQISDTYAEGKKKAVLAVSRQITETYWKVGEHIVEFDQDRKETNP
jgi:hypothetical protein